MVALPFSGHVNPTLGTAQALIEAGHEVTYVLDPRWRSAVEATGAQFVPYDNYPKDPGPFSRTLLTPRRAFATAHRIGGGFDCLIYEMLFSYGKALADRLEIPSIRLSSTMAFNRQMLDQLARSGGAQVSSLMRPGILNSILAASARRQGFMRMGDFVSEIVDNLPDVTFVYTSLEFQIDANLFAEERFQFIGPSLEHRLGVDLDDEVNNLPGPLIYISMGTLLNKLPGFYRDCIAAFADTEWSVVIATGPKVAREKLGTLPANVIIKDAVPQLAILERADLFITHGGMNSVNEAAYFGVPMIVIPRVNDQPATANQVQSLGLGTRLDPKAANEVTLRSAAEQLLRNPGLSSRMEAASQNMKRAGGNDRITSWITKLATQ